MNEINNVLKKHFFNKKFMNCHKKGRNYPRMVGRNSGHFLCLKKTARGLHSLY
jgi:hypothetical protein